MRDALRGTRYLLVTSVIGIAWASLLLSLLAAGVATLVIVVGAFVLIATTRLIHRVETVEVSRAARYLRTEVATSVSSAAAGPAPTSLPARLRHEWTPVTVRRALADVGRLATAPVLLTVTIALWAVPVALVSTPILTAVDLEPTEWTNTSSRSSMSANGPPRSPCR